MALDSVAKYIPVHRIEPAKSAMTNDTVLPFLFAAVQREKVTAVFDGGRTTPLWSHSKASCNRRVHIVEVQKDAR